MRLRDRLRGVAQGEERGEEEGRSRGEVHVMRDSLEAVEDEAIDRAYGVDELPALRG